MARFGGLFHVCQSISRPFKKNIISTMSYVDSDVDHQGVVKNSMATGTERHKKMMSETQSVLITAC
jgi:hypothetical protein